MSLIFQALEWLSHYCCWFTAAGFSLYALQHLIGLLLLRIGYLTYTRANHYKWINDTIAQYAEHKLSCSCSDVISSDRWGGGYFPLALYSTGKGKVVISPFRYFDAVEKFYRHTTITMYTSIRIFFNYLINWFSLPFM